MTATAAQMDALRERFGRIEAGSWASRGFLPFGVAEIDYRPLSGGQRWEPARGRRWRQWRPVSLYFARPAH